MVKGCKDFLEKHKDKITDPTLVDSETAFDAVMEGAWDMTKHLIPDAKNWTLIFRNRNTGEEIILE